MNWHTVVIPVVVLPVKLFGACSRPIGAAGAWMLQSLSQLVRCVTGMPGVFIAYHREDGRLFEINLSACNCGETTAPSCSTPIGLPEWRACAADGNSEFCSQIIGVFMNASFLISPSPPYAALIEESIAGKSSLCGNECTGDVSAFAERLEPGCEGMLHEHLHLLVECVDDLQRREYQLPRQMLPPAQSGPWNSQAIEGPNRGCGFRLNDAPAYLNTALEEACFDSRFQVSSSCQDVDSLSAALVELRNHSQVPWIFNELTNEIDYRTGAVRPRSFPPELHISLTSHCNLECRFCSRNDQTRVSDYVKLSDLERLDFLNLIGTLRLSAGNGEPTCNEDLPAIVRWLRRKLPHLAINFFTNGVLLDRRRLDALMDGNVSWINVSINAATRQTYQELCQADFFDRVCQNLKTLRKMKQDAGIPSPLVYASMVLTRDTVRELPLMPELCRNLGIDRFVAIPFFALGVYQPGRYTHEYAYHHVAAEYDRIYEETVEKANECSVSIELPNPQARKQVQFAIEHRTLHDFAKIERHEWQLKKLLFSVPFPSQPDKYCQFLWRQAAVTSAVLGQEPKAARWLYPCLGPLAPVVTAKQLAFDFPDRVRFEQLWHSRLLIYLREAQHKPGMCAVCDRCRGCDTRHPQVAQTMLELIANFARGWPSFAERRMTCWLPQAIHG